MEIFVGFVFSIAIFVFILLFFAAIRDYQNREVSNWVWVLGIAILPLTLYRLLTAGLQLLYGIQVSLIFILVIFAFRIGILGGADVKAILLISIIFSWIILNASWLILAPFLVLLIGFLILGIHSLIILIANQITWKQSMKRKEQPSKPHKRMYWITRRLTLEAEPSIKTDWKQVVVPLIVHFLIAYVILLIYTSGSNLIPI